MKFGLKILLTAGAVLAGMAAQAADDTPYLQENLQLWFRADKGLETNETGAVTAWRNQGRIGASADVLPVAVREGGSVTMKNPAKFGGRPAGRTAGTGWDIPRWRAGTGRTPRSSRTRQAG